jgi:uncharacterized Ntn-hydrolase superfamily protein
MGCSGSQTHGREETMNHGAFSRAIALLLLPAFAAPAQATFSIAAVDPVSGLVGSAGASCIAGSIILSDVHPGVGVIHTQAYWNSQNQQYARTLMNQGYSPAAIIDSLVAHDAQGNPTIRQYGIADRVGGGRTAAYTGVNCTDYHGHIPGPTYSIQGNILLGPEILSGMETAFRDTPGTLADRLMAALQAANVPGADTRCMQWGKPAISAFLRVALPSDPDTDLYLDLNVNNTQSSQNPIDLLQALYDQWKLSADVPGWHDATDRVTGLRDGVVLYPSQPNPFRGSTVICYEIPRRDQVTLTVFDLAGRVVATLVNGLQEPGFHWVVWSGSESSGCGAAYLCRLEVAGRARMTKVLQLSE